MYIRKITRRTVQSNRWQAIFAVVQNSNPVAWMLVAGKKVYLLFLLISDIHILIQESHVKFATALFRLFITCNAVTHDVWHGTKENRWVNVWAEMKCKTHILLTFSFFSNQISIDLTSTCTTTIQDQPAVKLVCKDHTHNHTIRVLIGRCSLYTCRIIAKLIEDKNLVFMICGLYTQVFFIGLICILIGKLCI